MVVTRLPNDATSCREWRAAFLASISRIDLSKTDVLVKKGHLCNGRKRKGLQRFASGLRRFHHMLNEHIAAELIKTGSIRKCGART